MSAPTDLDRLARRATLVLKDEPAARVEVLGDGEDRVVRKTYRNTGLRLLQTWLRRSRAEREFANLRVMADRGLPCTLPVACAADRRLGFVRSSMLATRYLPASRTLKATLAESATGTSARRALARALGTLLADLHAAGLLWGTAMPRNVLVLGDPAAAALVVCDVPAAIRCKGAVPMRLAVLDLFDALASPSRRLEWSRAERLRALLAYHRGDGAAAHATWGCLTRLTPFVHRLRKNLSMALRTYILPRGIPDHVATAP